MNSTATPALPRYSTLARSAGSKQPPHGGRRHSSSNATRPKRIARKGRPTLGRYVDRRGRPREIILQPGAGGSLLVLDRNAATLTDPRLLAHIASDEPTENAALVSRCFLERVGREHCACRPLLASDLESVPAYEDLGDESIEPFQAEQPVARDESGRRYQLGCLATGMLIPELRWCRVQADPDLDCSEPRPHPRAASQARRQDPELEPVSVREAVASLESYEPIRTVTSAAIAWHRRRGEVSVAVLRGELERTQKSAIVLNRGLRAAALDAIERRGESMSEIAMRCGRIKRDAAGNESGETSWLARRLGLLPEASRRSPTPWIHSDVLALIARDGLGLSPHEVEVH